MPLPLPFEQGGTHDQVRRTTHSQTDLLRAIHQYDDTLYLATVVGCLEFVKQQLIDEANEGDDD